MFPYWIFFLLPAVAAISARPTNRFHTSGMPTTPFDQSWVLAWLFMTAAIGLRYEVGGDWNNYFRYLRGAPGLSMQDLLNLEDPAYWALNMISAHFDWGMTGVNIMSAAIFSTGLTIFCRSLRRPWLALACAIPYLVIVVAMGYTRQSIALSLAMIGLVALQRSNYLRFGLWVVLGALFHKSAVLLIPIAAVTAKTNRVQVVGLIGLIGLAAYEALVSDYAHRLITVYQDATIQSSGAFIRLTMNAVPAALFVVLKDKFIMPETAKRLWLIISILSLAMFGLFFATNLSTALDRMALYFIPLQLVVFSYLPDILAKSRHNRSDWTILILVYFAIVQFVWLNFAVHARYWLPFEIAL